MREAVFILAVFGVILILTAVRYRRQIAGVIRMWRSLKSVREQIKQGRDTETRQDPISSGPLVNCARCGTWVPQKKAINLRGGVFYCSAACLETTTRVR